jgi:hypothetical protein
VASRVIINQNEIKALLTSPQGAVVQDLVRRGRNVTNQAKRNAPVDTGRLRADISWELRHDNVPFIRIGNSVNYALAVHEGTGIYGPTGQPIRPRRAKVLRFKVGGRVIYRPSVRGSRGRPYLRTALAAAVN